MPVPHEAFSNGDVYIDYPQEQVMFHYIHETGVVFRKFYGENEEEEVPSSSELFSEARRIGFPTIAERYAQGG